jgi:hypothetical protein
VPRKAGGLRESQITNHSITQSPDDPMNQWPNDPMLFDTGLLLCEDSAGEFPWQKIVVLELLWRAFCSF